MAAAEPRQCCQARAPGSGPKQFRADGGGNAGAPTAPGPDTSRPGDVPANFSARRILGGGDLLVVLKDLL